MKGQTCVRSQVHQITKCALGGQQLIQLLNLEELARERERAQQAFIETPDNQCGRRALHTHENTCADARRQTAMGTDLDGDAVTLGLGCGTTSGSNLLHKVTLFAQNVPRACACRISAVYKASEHAGVKMNGERVLRC